MVAYPAGLAMHLRRCGPHYDVVDASTGDAWIWLLSRRTGLHPSVAVSSHGLEHVAHDAVLADARANGGRVSWKYPLYHGGWRLHEVAITLRRSEAVFLLNEAERQFVCERLRVDASKVQVVPNGISDALANLPPPAAKFEGGLRLVQIGNYIRLKGTAWGALALNELMTQHPQLSVSFLGTRRPRDVVLADFNPAYHGRIRVLEEYELDALPSLLAGHDIVFHPALSEGFSLALLEGMACGLVPIATTAPGPGELVRTGQNGILVPPRDAAALKTAVERLIGDRDLLTRMKVAAQSTARRFTWRRVAEARLQVYERLIAA
jgi:glycosyltransferase involved in cell wall biosynthesis